jgi:hypothetical protein
MYKGEEMDEVDNKGIDVYLHQHFAQSYVQKKVHENTQTTCKNQTMSYLQTKQIDTDCNK